MFRYDNEYIVSGVDEIDSALIENKNGKVSTGIKLNSITLINTPDYLLGLSIVELFTRDFISSLSNRVDISCDRRLDIFGFDKSYDNLIEVEHVTVGLRHSLKVGVVSQDYLHERIKSGKRHGICVISYNAMLEYICQFDDKDSSWKELHMLIHGIAAANTTVFIINKSYTKDPHKYHSRLSKIVDNQLRIPSQVINIKEFPSEKDEMVQYMLRVIKSNFDNVPQNIYNITSNLNEETDNFICTGDDRHTLDSFSLNNYYTLIFNSKACRYIEIDKEE